MIDSEIPAPAGIFFVLRYVRSPSHYASAWLKHKTFSIQRKKPSHSSLSLYSPPSMIFKGFPDLGWLKNQIDQRFQQRRAYNNAALKTDGFPSVVINATVKESYRPDIMGPISLFLNLNGNSRCTVDNHCVNINEDFFFISNRFQSYTLEIDSKKPVETFNIHIGEKFSEGVLGALLSSADTILNNGKQQQVHTVAFYNRLYRRDEIFNQLLKQVQQAQTKDRFNNLLFEEKLQSILLYLLRQHRDIMQQVKSMPPVKLSTKIELHKRLGFAIDYIHSSDLLQLNIDDMAAAACLSKFHFLRLFRQLYGVSPYQFIQSLRIEKASRLLKYSDLPVQTIADDLGFENSNSFSRLFHQRKGFYPTAFRSRHN